MSRIRLAAVVTLIALGGASALAIASPGKERSDSSGEDHARAALLDADGNRVGRVVFFQHGDRVFVEVRARDLTQGFHGFHVHETGRCEPPFASAGGHLADDGQVHADHIGDLPALQAGADGRAYLLAATDRFTVSDLFDLDGSAAIVHADPDNYSNIPDRYRAENGEPGPDAETLQAGDSGARVACGVVR